MSDDERRVFEELLRAARLMCGHIGKPLPLMLETMPPFVRAANAAERILDPLRSPAERERVERDAY